MKTQRFSSLTRKFSLFPAVRSRFSRSGSSLWLPVAAAVAALAGPSIHAATVTWSDPLDNGDWSNSSFWAGVNKPPLAADTALFNSSVGTNGTVGLASNASITSISFDANAGSTNSTLTIGSAGGGTLTLGNNGVTQILSTLAGTGKTITLNAPLKLAGVYSFANNNTSSNVLVIGGAITNSAAASLFLGGVNTGGNTVSGAISNGTGATSLTKNGVGTWVLTGSNSYTGNTAVSAGTLVIGGNSGGINASAVTVKAGTLAFDSSTGVNSDARAKSVTLSAEGSAVTATGNAAADSIERITGALSLSAGNATVTLTPGAGHNELLSASSLARTTGVVLFRGVNLGVNPIASATAESTNIGFTTDPALIGAGAANTPTAGVLPWALIDNGSATGSGLGLATYDSTYGLRALNSSEYATSLTSGDTGNSNLKANADITFSAGTNTLVNSLTLGGGNLLGLGTLTLSSGAVFAASTGSINGPLFLGGEGYFNAAAGATLNVNNLNLTGAGGLNLGTNGVGTVNVTIATSGTLGHLATAGSANPDVSLTLADGITVTIGGDNLSTVYNGVLNGSGNLLKVGTGTLSVLRAGNHYSGDIEISQGTLSVPSGAGGTQNTYDSWVTTGALTIDSGANLNVSGQFGAGALLGSGTVTVQNRDFSINYSGSAVDTFSGQLAGTAGFQGYFLKFGTGTLSLTGSNSTLFVPVVNAWGTLQTPGFTGSNGLIVYGGTVKVTGTTGSVTGVGYSSSSGIADMTLAGGTLWVAPDTVNGSADIKVTGLTQAGVSNGRATNFNAAGGRVLLDKGGNNSVTYSVGGATAGALGTIVLSNGLIIAAAHGLSALGVTEKFTTATAAMTPNMTHGIVDARIVGQDASAGSHFNGDFLSYNGTGLSTDGGFTPYNYASANGDTNFSIATTNATVEKVTQDASLNNTAVFALRNDGKTLTINSGNTLTIGDGASTAAPGLIMNGGVITGGTLAFTSSDKNGGVSIYTSADNATISSTIKATYGGNDANKSQINVQGPGVLTYTGAALGNVVNINYGATFESGTASSPQGVLLNGGVFQSSGTFSRGFGVNALKFMTGVGGGFAARGGALVVNLGGSSSQMVWNNGAIGTSNFLGDYQSLIFGSPTADSEVTFVNPLDLGGNTANFSRVIDVIDNPNSPTDQVRFTGGVTATSANNGIAKDGAGRLILDGNNTYQGGTYVAAGSLVVSGSLSATSFVEVHNGATVGGTGLINASAPLRVEAGGKIAPGTVDGSGAHTTGALTAGNVSLASGAKLELTLGGATAGTYDRLLASSVNLNSDSGAGASLYLTLGFTPAGGPIIFDLIANSGGGAITGVFGSIYLNSSLLTFGAGNTFAFSYQSIDYNGIFSYAGTSGSLTGGHDLVLSFEAVPEGRTYGLMFLGGAVLAAFARRRKE